MEIDSSNLNAANLRQNQPHTKPAAPILAEKRGSLIDLESNARPSDANEKTPQAETSVKVNLSQEGVRLSKAPDFDPIKFHQDLVQSQQLANTGEEAAENLYVAIQEFDKLRGAQDEYDFVMREDGSLKVITESMDDKAKAQLESQLNDNKSIVRAARTLQDSIVKFYGDSYSDTKMIDGTDLRGLVIDEQSLSEKIEIKSLLMETVNNSSHSPYDNLAAKVSGIVFDAASKIKSALE